jgi:[acyl-carrier-protein] S-malonyltransferase
MGRALFETFPEVKALYQDADTVLGYPLSEICFNGPVETLQQTNYAQPALLTTETAHLLALQLRYADELMEPAFVAGHSLGEYAALVASGALAFEDALRLVADRGRLMHEAGSAIGTPTGMSAVLGLDDEAVRQVCEEAGVDLANLNAPGQVVMSGPIDALEAAGALARARGARRVVPLQVSAAFHSRWMRSLASEFSESLARATFTSPRIPVVANVTARPTSGALEIRKLLAEQTYSPVRWVETVEYMVAEGVSAFVEIGPGKVLSGLVKRIAPGAAILSSEDLLAQ